MKKLFLEIILANIGWSIFFFVVYYRTLIEQRYSSMNWLLIVFFFSMATNLYYIVRIQKKARKQNRIQPTFSFEFQLFSKVRYT